MLWWRFFRSGGLLTKYSSKVGDFLKDCSFKRNNSGIYGVIHQSKETKKFNVLLRKLYRSMKIYDAIEDSILDFANQAT